MVTSREKSLKHTFVTLHMHMSIFSQLNSGRNIFYVILSQISRGTFISYLPQNIYIYQILVNFVFHMLPNITQHEMCDVVFVNSLCFDFIV